MTTRICDWYCYVGAGLAVPLGLHEGTAVIIKFRLAEQAYYTVCECVYCDRDSLYVDISM